LIRPFENKAAERAYAKVLMKKNIAVPGILLQLCVFAFVCLSCFSALLRKFPHGVAFNAAQSGSIILLFCLSCAVIYHFWWHLADSVTDCGNRFIVRRRSRVQSIRIQEIAWVGFSVQKPPLVTFHLYHPSSFGPEISFVPAGDVWRILLDDTSLIAEQINCRIAAAKNLP